MPISQNNLRNCIACAWAKGEKVFYPLSEFKSSNHYIHINCQYKYAYKHSKGRNIDSPVSVLRKIETDKLIIGFISGKYSPKATSAM